MKLLILSFILSFSLNAQDYGYINFSLDANKAFHLKDNSRTVNDIYRLDYDVEVGARAGIGAVYMFYGRFNKAGFKNYGAGVDIYVDWFRWIDMSIGAAYSRMFKKDFRDKYAGVGWYAIRAVTTIWFHPESPFGLSLRVQLHDRSDTTKGYILEGSFGISIRI